MRQRHPRRSSRRRIGRSPARACVACVAISSLSTTNLSVGGQNPNNSFCGSTWSDASDNCSERRHCPGLTDEECTETPGQLCFAATLCDVTKGDGGSPPLPYDDFRNTRFCQRGWGGTAPMECTSELWCGDDESDCPANLKCQYVTHCHLHDIIEREKEEEAREAEEERWQALMSMDPGDPGRTYSCGRNWSDASARCGKWCSGDEADCPDGEGCFPGTLCYFNDGLVPSESPTTYAPTTRAPVVYDDPSNIKFCGKSWNTAPCSIEAHCPTGNECKRGETCYNKYGCNVQDLTLSPTSDPTGPPILPPEHPMYRKYCGRSYDEAAYNCRLDTLCESDADCEAGMSCYDTLPEYCNAFDLLHPGLRPTFQTTDPPTERPTTKRPTPPQQQNLQLPFVSVSLEYDDSMNRRFCGISRSVIICSRESHCPNGLGCPNGHGCFETRECNIHDLPSGPLPANPPPMTSSGRPLSPPPTAKPTPGNPTAEPTRRPSREPTSRAPSVSPVSSAPVTKAPTIYADPKNMRFCGKSLYSVTCSLESYCPTGSECRNGELCFTLLQCNIHDIIAASMLSPGTGAPNARAPVTKYPTVYDDPRNLRFCGASMYDISCSVESHCPTGVECKRGELCYTQPQCNIHDLKYPSANPSLAPVLPPPDFQSNNFKIGFCGDSYHDAVYNCSPITQCTSNDGCLDGDTCFDNLPEHCYSSFMINAESEPIAVPTESALRPFPAPEPTYRPIYRQPTYPPTRQTVRPIPGSIQSNADEVTIEIDGDSWWCGNTQENANRNCGAHSFWCVDFACPLGWVCFKVSSQLCGRTTTVDEEWTPRTISPTLTPVPTSVKPMQSPATDMQTKQDLLTPATIPGGPVSTLTTTTEPTTQTPISLSPTYPLIIPAKKQPLNNKKPNGGKETKPRPQDTAEDKLAGKENAQDMLSTAEDMDKATSELPSKSEEWDTASLDLDSTAEEFDTDTSHRLKLYCFGLSMNDFDQNCPYALECSVGIPCPTGHLCVQHDCMNRPQSSSSLDLCPPKYVGIYTKDCKLYYECDNYGYIGPTNACEEGYKYDKSTHRCIFEHLVNSECSSAVPMPIINDVVSNTPDENDEGGANISYSPSENPTLPESHMDGSPTRPSSGSQAPSPYRDPSFWSDSLKIYLNGARGSLRSMRHLPRMLVLIQFLLFSSTIWC